MNQAIRRMRNRIGRGHTFEKVWATIEKNAEEAEKRAAEWEAKRQKEAEQRQKEAEQRQKEAEQRQKAFEQQQKAFEEWKKEREKANKKIERSINALNYQMGGLHNSFGEMAEYMVAPGVVDLFNDIGYHITEDVTHNKRIRDEKKNIKAEIDLYMGNGEYIFAVEVKTSLGDKDIEHHRRRLEILREYINRTGDHRKIIGGMAVAVLDEADRKAVLDAGFYLLEPSGDMMKMDVPEGFVPREW